MKTTYWLGIFFYSCEKLFCFKKTQGVQNVMRSNYKTNVDHEDKCAEEIFIDGMLEICNKEGFDEKSFCEAK